LIFSQPIDLWDRIVNRLELWRDSPDTVASADAISLEDALVQAGVLLGRDLSVIARDPELKTIRDMIAAAPEPAFARTYDANNSLSMLCYVLCRALAPASVVETGVANGATSTYLLAALSHAPDGRLYSVDWMPGGARRRTPVGELVPDDLRGRWTLEAGPSRRLLAPLLRRIEPPSLFLHDSAHTYRNMRRELETVTPFLGRPGVVLVDDIQANASFDAWASAARPTYARRVATELPGHQVGMAIFA
jgi:hypothetical protein